jgi:hypothetical protein
VLVGTGRGEKRCQDVVPRGRREVLAISSHDVALSKKPGVSADRHSCQLSQHGLLSHAALADEQYVTGGSAVQGSAEILEESLRRRVVLER